MSNSRLNEIANRTLAKLSPDHAMREIGWLFYKIELDFTQDLHDRTEVYRQHMANIIPTLPAAHAAIAALVWQDLEAILAVKWDKPEPIDPDRAAEIQRLIAALRDTGDSTEWYKAVRAPHDALEEPDYEQARVILRSIGSDQEPELTTFWKDLYALLASGGADAYIQRRAERTPDRWPDVNIANWPASVVFACSEILED